VAARAERFAALLGLGQQAYVAGLLHDLGKYAEQMQQRLRGGNEPGRDHWSIGAYAALKKYKAKSLEIAAAIEGHHMGLQKLLPLDDDYLRKLEAKFHSDPCRFTETDLEALGARFQSDGFSLPKSEWPRARDFATSQASTMLDVRMLFSCLVDADFLETEAHFNGDADEPRRGRKDGPALDFARALAELKRYVAALRKMAGASPEIQEIRNSVFEACLRAGEESPTGLYTLDAPTGTGKTLALLAFALAHVAKHPHLKRIIVVLPFLNILDQTVSTYREVLAGIDGLDENALLEDHSLADRSRDDHDDHDRSNAAEPDNPERLRRLLAENWDAPIVLTTSVRCLEGLHANTPSACRKLHRMANSVLLFDEVQTIPTNLAVPTLATLAHLADRYRSTVVFATATQPAFSHLDERVRCVGSVGWSPRPLLSASRELFQRTAGRIRIRWEIDRPVSMSELAERFASRRLRQVLCIVNLKRHAARLLEELQHRGVQDLFHLSTQMCPSHRQDVLRQVIERLKAGQRVCLVATQCVEAGVDLSFPHVFRALGPLEAIAQAAGRCNRHGEQNEPGEVLVFLPQAESDREWLYPTPAYAQAADTTRTFLNHLRAEGGDLDAMPILSEPDRITSYYQLLYALKGSWLTHTELAKAIERLDFAAVGQEYRLIADNQINILVKYNENEFDRLVDEIGGSRPRSPDFYRDWIRRARPLTVGVYTSRLTADLRRHLIPIHFGKSLVTPDREADWYQCVTDDRYDRGLLGLKVDADPRMTV